MVASAKENVLDAFERLVIDRGERAATLEAVAVEAGVSKGGLLYHYGSKKDLVDAVISRVSELGSEYTEQLKSSPEGVVSSFIRTSVTTGTAFDNSYIALTRLAQSGIYPDAREALTGIERDWFTLIESSVGDAAVARLVLLVSDGLYYNSALFPDRQLGETSTALNEVIGAVDDLVRARSAD